MDTIYATHNHSPTIARVLSRCLEGLKDGELGLNVGSGSSDLYPNLVNLDLRCGAAVDCCANAECLPFADCSFSVIISQETLEHVRDPRLAVCQMYRVLSNGGTLYCQLPFIIGYHPGPTDFWRYSREGIRELIERAGFVCEEIGIAVGPATGFYRIAVEFVAIVSSALIPRLYYPTKGLAAVVLYPIKWLDAPLLKKTQADRIAGGYYIIARKTS